MFGFSVHEFFIFILIVVLLSVTGLWPAVVQAMRDLRGEGGPPPGAGTGAAVSRSEIDRCFRLLGISPSATKEEIERAYRRKAKMHHPDRGGDGDIMREINEAYSLIKRMKRL